MKKVVLLLVVLCFYSNGISQETQKNIDSLLNELAIASEDTSKVTLYRKIAGHYNVTHLDSALVFAEKGIELARKLNDKGGLWTSLNVLGNYYERRTDYPRAIENYNKALAIVEETNSTMGFAVVLNNIATINIHKAEYDDALKYLFDALKAEEKLGNRNGIAQAYNNIGVVYYYLQDFDKTTDYLTRALEIQEGLGNFDGLINGYNNVGAIRIHQKKYQEAIKTYEKALAISTKIDDKINQAIELSNIGICWTKMEDYLKAEEFYDRSLAIRDAINDMDGKANAMVNMGELFLEQKKYAKAEEYFERALQIATKNDLKEVKRFGYSGLAKLHEAKGDFKRAIDFLKQYLSVKDTILNENNARIIAETETKYETEKKEKEIFEGRTQLAEKELEVKKKNSMIYGSLGLALILGLLGYLFYSQQKLKNSQLKKEAELKAALTKIETQNHLQEQRLRISRDLHDNIGAQLTFIISSLDNLKYGFKDMNEKLSDKLIGISGFTSQTIYELRDTIWAMNKNEITFEDLQARISNFIDSAKVASDKTKFSFKIDPNVDQEHVFSSVEGMNIYRIIQEAVNNALKYSEAANINVLISEARNEYNISIKDDGKGFDETQTSPGNGLNNMKKRVWELKGNLNLTSASGKGTQLVFSVMK